MNEIAGRAIGAGRRINGGIEFGVGGKDIKARHSLREEVISLLLQTRRGMMPGANIARDMLNLLDRLQMQDFAVCDDADLSLPSDAANFLYTLSANIGGAPWHSQLSSNGNSHPQRTGVVQYNLDNFEYGGGRVPVSMDQVCAIMTNGSDALINYAAVSK